LFIIFGGATLIWTIIMFVLLPDSPKKATFLNEAEREIASIRIQNAQQTIQDGSYNMSQVKEAFIDPKTWLIFAYAFLTAVANGALTSVINPRRSILNFETAN
jgi:ACS family allantoate permease-like MFS transporter